MFILGENFIFQLHEKKLVKVSIFGKLIESYSLPAKARKNFTSCKIIFCDFAKDSIFIHYNPSD